MRAGPNTLVGLSKPADASAPFDHDSAIKALLPAYTELLTQLKALGVPEVQLHEPILTTSDAAKLKAEFESTYSELSKVGVPINLVSARPLPSLLLVAPFFLCLQSPTSAECLTCSLSSCCVVGLCCWSSGCC